MRKWCHFVTVCVAFTSWDNQNEWDQNWADIRLEWNEYCRYSLGSNPLMFWSPNTCTSSMKTYMISAFCVSHYKKFMVTWWFFVEWFLHSMLQKRPKVIQQNFEVFFGGGGGLFHWQYFGRNSYLMEISFTGSSRPNFDKVMTTKFCSCHNSFDVVAYAKVFSNLIAENEITGKQIFHRIPSCL